MFCAFLGTTPREDFIPYVADFYLQLENVKWTIVSGIVNDSLVMSVRNLGYSRNAGEFVRKYFNDIGSAGGHRAMAKAVVPLRAFREKFGNLQAEQFTQKVLELALEFLHEHQPKAGQGIDVGSFGPFSIVTKRCTRLSPNSARSTASPIAL